MTRTDNAPLSGEQVRRYLDRIGLADVPADAAPTTELLDRLIYAHQLGVPFSTADIALRPITPSLELDAIYKKLVEDEHGGYCFELNKLFDKLLLSLGFDARPCLSRSVRGRIEVAPINHRGELVAVEGALRFVDVGFGGPICAKSIPVADGAEVEDGSYRFICQKHDATWWRLDRITGGAGDIFGDAYEVRRQTELMFCDALVEDKDFNLLSIALSQPGSLFHDHLIVNLRTQDGYIGIMDMDLKIRSAAGSQAETFENEAQRAARMRELVGFAPYGEEGASSSGAPESWREECFDC
ncbi:MAG: arylamine N-acetyltransferase [Coriobacteriales bacterium]